MKVFIILDGYANEGETICMVCSTLEVARQWAAKMISPEHKETEPNKWTFGKNWICIEEHNVEESC